MLSSSKKAKLEKSVNTIEKRLDAFHSSFQEYKNLRKRNGDHSKPLSVSRKEPSENSLFDGLLQDFIRECTFTINSGSEEETNYQIIQENTPDPVVEIDPEGTILSTNPSFTNTFAFRNNELIGTSLFTLVPPKYHSGLKEGITRSLQERFEKYRDTVEDIIVFRAHPKEGKTKSVEGIFYTYEKDRNPVLVLLICDLSYNRSLYEELKEAKDHYDALSETIGETIIRIDEQFRIIFVNSSIKKTFGYNREEVNGEHFSILFPPGVFERHKDTFQKYFIVDEQHRKELGLDITIEVLGRSKRRGIFPMEMSFGNSKEFHGRTMTCILRDITQRKHNERKLRHLAYHDKLTGLGNRDLFNGDIRSLLQTINKFPEVLSALMFLDLDGFKQVNDTLGHDAGDTLLIETSRRLRSSLRETDSVYRFGGDEFVVLLNSIQKRQNAAMLGTKLLRAVREPYFIEKEENTSKVNVGVSIGIAIIPEDGNKPDVITKNADLAMYSAKESGKNTYVFYSTDMDKQAVERWELELGIKNGLANREFLLYYQPMVNPEGKVLGMEALVRWDHRQRGLISPDAFIPAAEETGLIIPMGKWILETACRTMHYLNTHGYPDLFMSVNVSPRQFDHPEFLNITSNIIRKTGIDPHNLKLELTETCIMNAPEEAIEKMHALKKDHPGISIAIDDFGTGYSSLSYLSRLPADIIKIDLSFVTKLSQKSNQKIVNAIINLAQGLELELVAEGVEGEKQITFFSGKGCRLLQGFYFYEPLDFDELMTVI
ncbi:MAG: EAL domain-containing protein [Spirochaetales bacterium]|nr:EAL domain-containing protein [Spirochaetales bacterium]MCF7939325.1 EAL domain-containing protein [Spirochaetales bacterium]